MENKYSEDVEYAIVDETNKRLFEEDLAYQPYEGIQGKGVRFKPGFARPSEESLFVCVCNDNKITPVNVFFTRQEIILDTEQLY